MAVKRSQRDVSGKVARSMGEKKSIRMSLTQDDALTITFPGPIVDLVRPITKDDGEVPIEYLFTLLEQYVALRARAVLAATGAPSPREWSDPLAIW
jgi:hypothetical protein